MKWVALKAIGYSGGIFILWDGHQGISKDYLVGALSLSPFLRSRQSQEMRHILCMDQMLIREVIFWKS